MSIEIPIHNYLNQVYEVIFLLPWPFTNASQFIIHDASCKLLMRQPIQNRSDETVDVSALARGTYAVTVYATDGKSETRLFQKQ